MKTKIFTLLGIFLIFLSCNEELIEFQEEAINQELKFSLSSNLGGSNKIVEKEYTTINLDRCDANVIQNFWWPTTPTTWDSGHFASDSDHQLNFTTYTDGTALISGQTIMGTCVVDVNVWLIDKMDWDTFSAPANGGSHKDEANDCTDVDPTILDYYVIDSSKSTITANGGDCLEEGTFGVEQRPDPQDNETPHLGVLVGKGAGLFDAANKDMDGVSTWGWLTKDGERNWIMDFNFNIEPKVEECFDCDGNITKLELQYNGDSPASIVVETEDKGVDGSKIVFEGNVAPGETFSFMGNDEDGTLGKKIKIYVNDKYVKLYTDCKEAIGPGLIIGDFEVISGKSLNGGNLCPIPCEECKGGVTSFTVEYTGTTAASLMIFHKDGTLFNETVIPGQTVTLSGSKDDGKFEEKNLIFKLDGNFQSAPGHDSGEVHMSCSKPFYVGLPIGDKLVVVSGTSNDNGPICEDTPPNNGDCSECDGKVTKLELQYNGSLTGNIKIIQKKDDIVAYTGMINPGTTFMFVGQDDKGTLGTEIKIYINGSEVQKIHTSCSDPIGPGAVFGDFTVISGASRNGGELCPVDTPSTSAECDCDGKIISMAVVYGGSNGATVTVGDNENGNNAKSFPNVQTGDILNVNLGEIGNWWYWSVDGNVQAAIHTSCSDDILGNVDAEKSTFGNLGNFPNPEENNNKGTFLVVSHTDNDGNTCTLDGYDIDVPPADQGGDDCNECDGKVTRLDLQYNGNQSANIVVETKKEGIVFEGDVNAGETFTFFGNDKKGTLGTEITISVNGNTNTKIHTSCSVEIHSGSVFGDFTVKGGASRNGGEFCSKPTSY